MKDLTIKEIAKKQKMSYQEARYYVRKMNEAGIIKPCGRKGKETLWDLSDFSKDKLKEIL